MEQPASQPEKCLGQPGSQPGSELLGPNRARQTASQAGRAVFRSASQPAKQAEQCSGHPASQAASQPAFVSGLDSGAKGVRSGV